MRYAGFPMNGGEAGVAGPGLAETNAFVAILEQKSFAHAASHLGWSPPRVSEMLRKLEDRLGVRLVERTTRSVAPTVAGERLLARLRPVLEDYQAALESIGDLRDRPAGLVRLTVAPPAADFVLAPALAPFLARYPEISLEISVDSTLTDIVAGRFDAGIRPGTRLERDMIAVRVSEPIRSVVVAAPSYLARRSPPKTPRELTAHNCIRVRLASGLVFPWQFRDKRKTFEIEVTGTVMANETSIALRAALDGIGMMQAASAYAAPHIAAGRLVAMLDEWAPPPNDGFFLYYPSRRQARPALTALVTFLRDALKSTSRMASEGN